jgi:SLOG cluster2
MSDLTPAAGKAFLVGVSISDPSPDELIRLGLSDLHVRHAFMEVVRHVLARGGSIAYGGDLRAAGYTEALFDLVRTYERKDFAGPDRVHSYLAWPIWLDVTPAQRADLANIATIKEVPRPDGAPDLLPLIGDRKPEDLLWNSLALTSMREAMTSAIRARVVLGGRVSGQQGLLPGVLEEAALAVRTSVPLYLAGGFGGCAQILAGAVSGSAPSELTLDYQLRHTPRYQELFNVASSSGVAPVFDELLGSFIAAGVEGLNNGLNVADNQRLFVTDDVDEVVALVLRGLRQVTDVA